MVATVHTERNDGEKDMLDQAAHDTVAIISSLSPRRREALMHLAAGYSDEEIAQKMALSASTIVSYTSMTYSALGLINLPNAAMKRTTAMRMYREWKEVNIDTADTSANDARATGQEATHTKDSQNDAESEGLETSFRVDAGKATYNVALTFEISDRHTAIGLPVTIVLGSENADREASALEMKGYQLEGMTQFLLPDRENSIVETAIYVRRRK